MKLNFSAVLLNPCLVIAALLLAVAHDEHVVRLVTVDARDAVKSAVLLSGRVAVAPEVVHLEQAVFWKFLTSEIAPLLPQCHNVRVSPVARVG